MYNRSGQREHNTDAKQRHHRGNCGIVELPDPVPHAALLRLSLAAGFVGCWLWGAHCSWT